MSSCPSDKSNDSWQYKNTRCQKKIGSSWVHLRLCLPCGHVGRCDSSPNKHGTKHFKEPDHPVMKSQELGEDSKWRVIHELFLKR